MANRKGGAKRTGQRASAPGNNGGQRLKQISKASSQIIQDAAALLDEEIAAGIVAAKKMQQRFQKERRIDPTDFKEALQRFQSDAHEIVNLLNEQGAEMRSQENAELITHLVNNTHDLLDLVVGLANIGAEITNQLVQANLSKQDAGYGKERPH